MKDETILLLGAAIVAGWFFLKDTKVSDMAAAGGSYIPPNSASLNRSSGAAEAATQPGADATAAAKAAATSKNGTFAQTIAQGNVKIGSIAYVAPSGKAYGTYSVNGLGYSGAIPQASFTAFSNAYKSGFQGQSLM